MAGAMKPFSAAAATSSFSCHSQPFRPSLTRPPSQTQMTASCGR